MEQLIDIAESAVVGAIILDAKACTDIFPRLSPDMFYNETMKELYKAAYRLQARGGNGGRCHNSRRSWNAVPAKYYSVR